MVAVAQLEERRNVDPVDIGSMPIVHPKFLLQSAAETAIASVVRGPPNRYFGIAAALKRVRSLVSEGRRFDPLAPGENTMHPKLIR